MIRKAKISDAEEILSLYNENNNLRGDNNIGYVLENIIDYIKKDQIFVYCADEIIGLCQIEVWKNYIHFHILIVKKEFQNQGIGDKLMKFIENYAKENEIFLIELMVEKKNIKMQKILEKKEYTKGKEFYFYSKNLI